MIRNYLSNKKIIASTAIVLAVAAIAIMGTTAYFTDTETSAGNKFVVGKMNLQLDNTCHYNGMVCTENGFWAEEVSGSSSYPALIGQPCQCTWSAKDLTDELFFNFPDIKPGDEGEDTVSIHVDNNDAWVCAEIMNLKDDDNGCEKPESDIDTTCGDGEGDVRNNLFFTIWKDDDCDNILDEPDEQILVNDQPATSGLWPIADSTTANGPITAKQDYCIGVSWQVPLSTSNIIQSDSLEGDVKFTAVQARHMDQFKCSDLYQEVCDGVDNDYDGQIDEGELWSNKGQSCLAGIGACEATGTYICDANNPSGPTVCSASAGNPGEEICNGTDDNCDGVIDEGNPGGGNSCETGLQGICSAGTLQCQSGALQCVQNLSPTTEICNGIDDDCDGLIDETFPEYGQFCSCMTTIPPYVPYASSYQCVGGVVSCNCQ